MRVLGRFTSRDFKEPRFTGKFGEVCCNGRGAPCVSDFRPDSEAFLKQRNRALAMPFGNQHRRMSRTLVGPMAAIAARWHFQWGYG